MIKCTTDTLDFPIDKVECGFFPALFLYSQKIDVIFNSKIRCNGADRCKLSFELQGKQIGGVSSYQPDSSQYAFPVSSHSPDKGYFMYEQNLKSIVILLVDEAGKGQQLTKVQLNPEAIGHRVSYTNALRLFSYCRMQDLVRTNLHKIYNT